MEDYFRTVMEHVKDLEWDLDAKHPEWEINAYATSNLGERDGRVWIRLRRRSDSVSQVFSNTLPVWVYRPPPFPEGRMAHFMGIADMVKSRARVDDWKQIVSEMFDNAATYIGNNS